MKMSFTSNLRTSTEFAAVVKNTPQIFKKILLKLSENILSVNELLLLKRDLLFVILVVIMIENGFQPIIHDCEVFDPGAIDDQLLSKWKLSSGLYEAEFVMLGYSEISTKLILIPLATTALVNTVINEIASEAYSVCLSIEKYIVFTKQETEVSQMFCNLQQLSDIFKNQVLSPVKSKILSACGYPGPSLMELPEDIFLKIMLYLPISDIINVSVTSKKCNQYVNEDNFWHKLYLRDYHNFKFTHSTTQFDVHQNNNWKLLYITCYTSYQKTEEERRKELLRIQRRDRFDQWRLGIPSYF